MASCVIHMCVASELNKKLKRKYKKLDIISSFLITFHFKQYISKFHRSFEV